MNENNENNQYKAEENEGNHSTQDEKIHFDEQDFSNPYSKYYSQGNDGNSKGNSGNDPFTSYYGDNGSGREQDKCEFDIDKDPFTSVFIDESREKAHFTRIGIGYAVFSIITFAVSLVIQIIVLSVNQDFYNSTLFLNLLTPISLYLFALPVLLMLLTGCEAAPPKKRKLGIGSFLLFLIAAFGFMYIGAIIGNSFMDFLSRTVNYDYSNGLGNIVDNENLWLTAIFTVIVAPIGEEFVFRKLIIDRTAKYGAAVSIGLSGLMFGLMHGNFYQFFYCFILGLLLGYIYYNTGKLYLTILIHAIVNFTGSILTSLMSPLVDALSKLDPSDTDAMITLIGENLWGFIGIMVFNAFVYISMACAVIFPIVFRKKLKFGRGEIEIPRRRIIPVVILNTGIVCMLIVYASEFILNLLPL